MSGDRAKPIITCTEAAEILGMTEGALRKWRERGIGPKYIEYESGSVRYRRSDVEQYLKDSEVEPDERDS